jgi:hypothetical protein
MGAWGLPWDRAGAREREREREGSRQGGRVVYAGGQGGERKRGELCGREREKKTG